MAKVTTDEEGVARLINLASALDEATESIEKSAAGLKSSFEDKRSLLGPHTSEFNEIIDLTTNTSIKGDAAVSAVSLFLRDQAQAISDFIANKSGGASGN